MATTDRTFRILVGLDFSDTSERALEAALDLARRHAPVELHVATVIDEDDSLSPYRRSRESLVEIGDRVRDRLTALARKAAPDLRTIAHVRVGHAAEELAQLAAEVEADQIVVGTHGRRGLRRLLLGSVAEGVVRIAPCPVLVVRPKQASLDTGIPAPEPPCPKCVETRVRTEGKEWWCEEHRRQPEPAHRYAYSSVLDPESPPGHLL